MFQNFQNLDAVLFLDIGNIWGVDYDTSIDDSDEIRSSVGSIDWFSVIGPINFLTEAISKADTDITETFRFNIGTTFDYFFKVTCLCIFIFKFLQYFKCGTDYKIC